VSILAVLIEDFRRRVISSQLCNSNLNLFSGIRIIIIDKLCMVANINTRKLIEILRAEIKLKEIKIEELEQWIDSLEQK
jgi:hypothetical protein